MNQEAATSRNIRIGKVSIGLIGLDTAINEALRQGLSEAEAMDFLYRRIERKNYIPASMREQYRLALLREYGRHLQGEDETGEALVIRIFGPGCISCNGLQNLVIEIVSQMNIPADIEQIHDPDEIGRAGILQTPALMINGRLKSSGLLPTRAQVEAWIKAACP